ncbi:hypothetical protein MMC09_003931 [Bachmanniomyces sp. S44760]|nr:hypothetical protein [Bachmanniomyces sp. S44760]
MSVTQNSLKDAIPTCLAISQEKILHSCAIEAPAAPSKCDYELRPLSRTNRADLSTWLDQDNSGDFNPDGNGDFQPGNLGKKRERPLPKANTLDGSALKKPRSYTWQLGRKEGVSHWVSFKIRSKKGCELLQKLRAACPFDKAPGISSDRSGFEFLSVGLTSASVQLHRLRAVKPKWDEIDREVSFADITLGHPAARGCKACLETGLSCPLLQEGVMYPCNHCEEDDVECELILQPVKKRCCENCRRRRTACSYREDESYHDKPCRQCALSRLKCIAGPQSGRTRTGPCLDRMLLKNPKATKFIPTSERPFASCTACRRAKKWCSLYHINSIKAPCKRCRIDGLSCTFEKLTDQGHKVCTDKEKHDKSLAQRKDEEVLSVTGYNSPVTRTVKTRLAYPLQINHAVPVDGSSPCHWCEDLAYGILGLKEDDVELIDRHDGLGFVLNKIKHGYLANGPSRMCIECTYERMMLIACSDHEIWPITGIDPNQFNDSTVLEWLMPRMATEAPFDWCTVCPSPAFFTCRKQCSPDLMAVDTHALGSDYGQEAGCGLKLCESCAVSFLEEHRGNLTGLILRLAEDQDVGTFDIRADATLVCRDGEILRQLRNC